MFIHVASRLQPPAPNLAQQAFAFECSGLGHAVEVGVLAHFPRDAPGTYIYI